MFDLLSDSVMHQYAALAGEADGCERLANLRKFVKLYREGAFNNVGQGLFDTNDVYAMIKYYLELFDNFDAEIRLCENL